MHGAHSSSFLAEIVVSHLEQGLIFVAPVLAFAAVWWLISRTNRVVHYLFPYLEWEHSLGWLNIKAERRAETAMRWVRFGIYVLLIDALVGIIWSAEGLPLLATWSDPLAMGELALRVPALFLCLGIWTVYLGGYLIPRLRAERERAEWKKFQAEMGAQDEARKARGEEEPLSRVKTPLRKPRTNTPAELPQQPMPITLQRSRRSHGPGG